MTTITITGCDRCNRPIRTSEGWSVVHSGGVIVGLLCPGCQTPAEPELPRAIRDAYAIHAAAKQAAVRVRDRQAA